MDRLIDLLITKFDTIFTLIVTLGGAGVGFVFSLIQQKRLREWELQNKWIEWHEHKISSVIIEFLDEQLELMSIMCKSYQYKYIVNNEEMETSLFMNLGKAKIRIEAFNDDGLRLCFEMFQKEYDRFKSSIYDNNSIDTVKSYIIEASKLAGKILRLLKSQKKIIKSYKK